MSTGTDAALPILLLVWAAGSTLWFLKGDLAGSRRLRWSGGTQERRQRYRLLAARIAIGFGLPAMGGLLLLGRLEALAILPPEFAALAVSMPGRLSPDAFAIGGGGGMLLGGALAIRAGRRGQPPPNLGDFTRLLPREPGELPGAALVALCAAISEEAFFRLLLPLVCTGLGAAPMLGFVGAALLFGAMHRYQGWLGMAATGLFGLLLAWTYLASGTFWVPVAVHLVADLNGLILRPLLAGAGAGLRRRSPDRTGGG